MNSPKHIDPNECRGRLYHAAYMRNGVLGELDAVPYFLEEGPEMVRYFRQVAKDRLVAGGIPAEERDIVIINWQAYDKTAHLPRTQED
jgi:hypothetical protein